MTLKLSNIVLGLLLLSASSFAMDLDEDNNDTLNKNPKPTETKLQGFVIFNKANFHSVKESLILKEMQVVAVLEPNVQDYKKPQITFSVAKLQETKNASKFKKYKQTKLKTPIAAVHHAVFSSLQPNQSSYILLFNSNTDKISLNLNTYSPKKLIPQKIKYQTLQSLLADSGEKTIQKNSTKFFKLFVKPTFFYGSSAFANRPPPASSC